MNKLNFEMGTIIQCNMEINHLTCCSYELDNNC